MMLQNDTDFHDSHKKRVKHMIIKEFMFNTQYIVEARQS